MLSEGPGGPKENQMRRIPLYIVAVSLLPSLLPAMARNEEPREYSAMQHIGGHVHKVC